jgi:hypothetical protein
MKRKYLPDSSGLAAPSMRQQALNAVRAFFCKASKLFTVRYFPFAFF